MGDQTFCLTVYYSIEDSFLVRNVSFVEAHNFQGQTFYASAPKVTDRGIMFPGCPSVRISVRIFSLTR